MAVLAPMPKARTKMAAMEKPGLRRRIRKENRKSESKFRMGRRLRAPQARPSAVTYSTDESGSADVSMNFGEWGEQGNAWCSSVVAKRGTGGRGLSRCRARKGCPVSKSSEAIRRVRGACRIMHAHSACVLPASDERYIVRTGSSRTRQRAARYYHLFGT